VEEGPGNGAGGWGAEAGPEEGARAAGAKGAGAEAAEAAAGLGAGGGPTGENAAGRQEGTWLDNDSILGMVAGLLWGCLGKGVWCGAHTFELTTSYT
jgi:hypothetical protein